MILRYVFLILFALLTIEQCAVHGENEVESGLLFSNSQLVKKEKSVTSELRSTSEVISAAGDEQPKSELISGTGETQMRLPEVVNVPRDNENQSTGSKPKGRSRGHKPKGNKVKGKVLESSPNPDVPVEPDFDDDDEEYDDYEVAKEIDKLTDPNHPYNAPIHTPPEQINQPIASTGQQYGANPPPPPPAIAAQPYAQEETKPPTSSVSFITDDSNKVNVQPSDQESVSPPTVKPFKGEVSLNFDDPTDPPANAGQEPVDDGQPGATDDQPTNDQTGKQLDGSQPTDQANQGNETPLDGNQPANEQPPMPLNGGASLGQPTDSQANEAQSANGDQQPNENHLNEQSSVNPPTNDLDGEQSGAHQPTIEQPAKPLKVDASYTFDEDTGLTETPLPASNQEPPQISNGDAEDGNSETGSNDSIGQNNDIPPFTVVPSHLPPPLLTTPEPVSNENNPPADPVPDPALDLPADQPDPVAQDNDSPPFTVVPSNLLPTLPPYTTPGPISFENNPPADQLPVPAFDLPANPPTPINNGNEISGVITLDEPGESTTEPNFIDEAAKLSNKVGYQPPSDGNELVVNEEQPNFDLSDGLGKEPHGMDEKAENDAEKLEVPSVYQLFKEKVKPVEQQAVNNPPVQMEGNTEQPVKASASVSSSKQTIKNESPKIVITKPSASFPSMDLFRRSCAVKINGFAALGICRANCGPKEVGIQVKLRESCTSYQLTCDSPFQLCCVPNLSEIGVCNVDLFRPNEILARVEKSLNLPQSSLIKLSHLQPAFIESIINYRTPAIFAPPIPIFNKKPYEGYADISRPSILHYAKKADGTTKSQVRSLKEEENDDGLFYRQDKVGPHFKTIANQVPRGNQAQVRFAKVLRRVDNPRPINHVHHDLEN